MGWDTTLKPDRIAFAYTLLLRTLCLINFRNFLDYGKGSGRTEGLPRIFNLPLQGVQVHLFSVPESYDHFLLPSLLLASTVEANKSTSRKTAQANCISSSRPVGLKELENKTAKKKLIQQHHSAKTISCTSDDYPPQRNKKKLTRRTSAMKVNS